MSTSVQEKEGKFLDATSVDNIIDEIIKENKAQRFASELAGTSEESRKNDIREIIRVLEGATKIDFNVIGKNKLDAIYDNMNTHTLHGKWSKLSIPQKKDRMKKYLDDNIKNEDIKNKAMTMLNLMIDKDKEKNKDKSKGKLKKNAIVYDEKKGEITSINVKEYDELINEKNSNASDASDCSDNSDNSEAD